MFSRRLLLALTVGASLLAAAATTSRAGLQETIAPETTATLDPSLNANGWANENVEVTLLALDNQGGSGVESVTYFAAGAQTIASTTINDDQTTFTINQEGTTVVHFFATDVAGNVETEQTVTVRIDKTEPTVTVRADPKKLWPPNKRTVTVTVTGQISDELSGVDFSSGGYVLIDEYGDANTEGDITINENGTYRFTVDVVASRKGRDKNGRTYTIKVSALDEAGNSTTTTTTVVVPHDKRKKNRGGGNGRGNGNGNGNGNGRR